MADIIETIHNIPNEDIYRCAKCFALGNETHICSKQNIKFMVIPGKQIKFLVDEAVNVVQGETRLERYVTGTQLSGVKLHCKKCLKMLGFHCTRGSKAEGKLVFESWKLVEWDGTRYKKLITDGGESKERMMGPDPDSPEASEINYATADSASDVVDSFTSDDDGSTSS